MKLNKAIVISIVAHLFLIALLAFNFHFSKIKPKASNNHRQMNATAVNAASVKNLLKNIKQKDIDKKNREIERLRKTRLKKEDERKKKLEQEKKAEDKKRRKIQAEDEKKNKKKIAADNKKKRIADEKAHNKKIALEKKKKEEKRKAAEAEKKRKAKEKAEAEKKRKKKLEDERKRKEAEEQAAMEREMDLQMAAETEELNAAHRQQVMTEVDKYRLLIENKIQRNWIEPEGKGFCNFRMKLAPGGLVLNVISVSGDQLHCETGQRAVYKSEPLPVSSDPDVFAELKDSYFQLKNSDDE